QHAAVVVAPLRLARGIQNKVLEAMAMGRPVVAASSCVDALGDAPTPGMPTSPVAAADADGFVREVDALLRDPARAAAVGAAGRERVRRDFGWAARLSLLDRRLAAAIPAPHPAQPATAALAA
ncbi:MAG: glycosyltransferase, partial [Rubrivivax sp.]|nr:glycosyltransferase [Rubrivivax sp.]